MMLDMPTMQTHMVDTDMMVMDSSRLMTIRVMTIRGMIMDMITLLMALDSTIMVDPRLVVDMVVPRLVVDMAVRRLVGMEDRKQGMRTRMLEADTSIRDMTSMVMLVDKLCLFSCLFSTPTPPPGLAPPCRSSALFYPFSAIISIIYTCTSYTCCSFFAFKKNSCKYTTNIIILIRMSVHWGFCLCNSSKTFLLKGRRRSD